MNVYDNIMAELTALANEEKVRVLSGFFKTGKGQYGEGDKFLGIPVPQTRGVARRYKDAPLSVAVSLLGSELHEVRLCALLIMVDKMKKAGADDAREIVETYLANTRRINNWDLVDLSAPQIVGGYLQDKPHDLLYRLADSSLLWDNRIAMVSTYTFIKAGQLDDTFMLAQKLIAHPHELIHKAVGWMLREAGKRDFGRLRSFVDEHWREMPRTMLRYAIEKYPENERKEVLGRR